MKLKNKKTGEVFESFKGGPIDLYFYPNEHKGGDDIDRKTYESLAELNSEWEDYKPAEPLIKDDKIRKAVRAWAEVEGVKEVRYDRYSEGFSYGDERGDLYSTINWDGFCHYLADGKTYTIEELCGEEE